MAHSPDPMSAQQLLECPTFLSNSKYLNFNPSFLFLGTPFTLLHPLPDFHQWCPQSLAEWRPLNFQSSFVHSHTEVLLHNSSLTFLPCTCPTNFRSLYMVRAYWIFLSFQDFSPSGFLCKCCLTAFPECYFAHIILFPELQCEVWWWQTNRKPCLQDNVRVLYTAT